MKIILQLERKNIKRLCSSGSSLLMTLVILQLLLFLAADLLIFQVNQNQLLKASIEIEEEKLN